MHREGTRDRGESRHCHPRCRNDIRRDRQQRQQPAKLIKRAWLDSGHFAAIARLDLKQSVNAGGPSQPRTGARLSPAELHQHARERERCDRQLHIRHAYGLGQLRCRRATARTTRPRPTSSVACPGTSFNIRGTSRSRLGRRGIQLGLRFWLS